MNKNQDKLKKLLNSSEFLQFILIIMLLISKTHSQSALPLPPR